VSPDDRAPALFHPEASAYAEGVMARADDAFRHGAARRDLAYGPHPRQKLDLFLPRGARGGALPLLVFIHGGGWMNGQKEWMAFMAPAILALPAAFASLNYRLAPAARWPLPLDDCLAGTAWLVANAARFGVDPARIYLGGHSAGAHLAAGVAVRHRKLAGARIRACLPISGTFDMRFANVFAGSMEERIQRNLFASPADAEDASPILAVDAGTPPFLIAWGDQDFPRIKDQGSRLACRLGEAGVRHEVLVLPGDHFAASAYCVELGAPWLAAAARWIGALPEKPSMVQAS
jgi:acetyl esterase/lipase